VGAEISRVTEVMVLTEVLVTDSTYHEISITFLIPSSPALTSLEIVSMNTSKNKKGDGLMDHPATIRDIHICQVCPRFLIRACSDVLESLDKEAVLHPMLSLKRPNMTGRMNSILRAY